jgi:alpha-mannosidase
MRSVAVLSILLPLAATPLLAGEGTPASSPLPQRRLYVVATSHLDTQWRWTIQDTIDDFLPATLRGNFALFDKYPGYDFSFEGAFRYALAKEYYPAEYARLKEYVREGRWKVAGSWICAVDTNVPSPESLIRQTLYGNGFFRREFGVTSRDVYLPDCFGFGFALPSIAAQCGLVAFSTQKLTWGSSIKIPFDLGRWEGVDGSQLIAELNPGDYASEIKGNLTLDPDVYATIDRQYATSGLPWALKYFGTGDVGVPPLEPSVEWLVKSEAGPGPLQVESVAPDQLARDLIARDDRTAIQRLPHYRGEFLLTSHGTGCYTSQAAMKRYNRTNQRWARAAESAAVAAWWLGGEPYPRETLRDAWTRFLWHQFHDDLTGTSIPPAYLFSWNDEALAANTFTDVLSTSVGAVARGLDTRGEGVPLVVYNPLAIDRDDTVEATVRFPGAAPKAVRVVTADERPVPAQLVAASGHKASVVFVAHVGPVSYAVFHVLPAAMPARHAEMKVTAGSLENARYRVSLDAAGDVASVFDKLVGRELLSAPLRLQLFDDAPHRWSAWEVEYGALSAPPREVVGGPATVRIVERGPARVALEVVRHAAGSTFTQRISLAAGGAGDHLELLTDIDWRTKGTLLKAAFPLAAENPVATYDLGLGVVQRPTDRPNLYEVPAQEWADITDTGSEFGAAVLNDSRHGWDKPDDHTLRLSLMHTPHVVPNWSWLDDQNSNDLGHHRVLIALAGHAGDWRAGSVAQAGDRLNVPLLAWQADAHNGPLGPSFSLLRVDGEGGAAVPVAVRALKLAEDGDEIVVRLQELSGKDVAGVRLDFAAPVVDVREVNGAEEPITEHGTGGALPPTTRSLVGLEDGTVVLNLAPFQPRTLEVKLAPAPVTLGAPTSTPLALPFDRVGITPADARRDGDFDGEGHTIAGELLPATVVSAGIAFRTGPREKGSANVLACRGQKITLPAGDLNRAYLLAAAVGGDRAATFVVDGKPMTLLVPDWAEPVGQWNSRIVAGRFVDDPERIAPGYAKTVPLAWVGTHRHDARGENEAYVFTYLFRLRLDLPPGARTLTLPNDPHLRVAAITAARDDSDAAVAAQPFIDPVTATVVHVSPPAGPFLGRTSVTLTSPNPGATIRYTLDGGEPTETSNVYAAPITLERTTTLKTRAFAPGLDDHFVATATFTKVAPRPAAAIEPDSLAPGLDCRLYEGDWRSLPDFDSLTPARTLTLARVELPADAPREHWGMACRGFVSVPADALYTVKLRSADGSVLGIDGETVVVDETIDFIARRGQVALAAGLHPISLRYFHRTFVAGLELEIDAPGAPLEPVPASRFFHVAADR